VSAPELRAGHPSALALDRHALGIAPPDVAAHVAGCEDCRARVGDVPSRPLEVPGWARGLGPRRVGWLASWSWRGRGLAIGLAAFACIAVVWKTRTRQGDRDEDGGYVGGYLATKGAPEVRLFVKHGERVALWDPSVHVVAGDLLRLEIQPDRYAHVSLFEATRSPGAYERLYDAVIAAGRPTALPSSWRVDAEPGDETLVVVLGPGSVAPDEVARLLASGDGGRHWTRRLVVAKSAANGGSPP
jgi:hypothetical protein